jgi:asparagine synthase (glutamine-hydrolysing)
MTGNEQLSKALDDAVRSAISEGPSAILFSGGLDSGLLAALAKRHGTPHLYTVGIEGSHDLRMGEEAASALDLPWTPFVLTSDEIIAECRRLLAIAQIDSPVVLSFELPLQIIASRVKETVLLSGQGADEMFGGYNRYLQMAPVELEKEMRKDLAGVLATGAPLDFVIAAHYEKAIKHPFLNAEVVKAASLIPVEQKISNGVRKAPLRKMLSSLGYDIIAQREKKAAQYGSGFMKVIKAKAKQSNLELQDFMNVLRTEQF